MAKKASDFDTDIAKFTPRQLEVCKVIDEAKAKYILYGGAVGGGKSFLLRWVAVRILMQCYLDHQIKNAQVMLACEDYPSLKDRQIGRITTDFPAWLGKYHDDHRAHGKCFILAPQYGSGIICLRNLDDPSKYQSAEFVAILVDELTKNPLQTFTDLRMRIRWPGMPDNECIFIGATNPGGIGHNYCKAYWIDRTYPPEFIEPIDYRPLFKFIPSKAEDNPHLDASYWSVLNTLPENLRQAFRDGSWDVYQGQAFTFSRENHVLKSDIPIPEHAPLYTTFDWGFGAPFSWLWWWIDADGRAYLFSEWYGWNGTPNQGLRWEDSRVAREILNKEDALAEKYKINFKDVTRLTNPDCFQKKPDYKGGGQGPSTAEVFAQHGIYLSPGDPSRSLKIRQFRERLKIPEDGTMPMLMVYPSCSQFIRTIPDIPVDKNDPEAIDDKSEEHCYDSAALLCMARPIALQTPKPSLTQAQKHIEKQQNKGKGGYEEVLIQEAVIQEEFLYREHRRMEGRIYGDVD